MGSGNSKSVSQVQPPQTDEPLIEEHEEEDDWCIVQGVVPTITTPNTLENNKSHADLFLNGVSRVYLRNVEMIPCFNKSCALDSDEITLMPVDNVLDAQVPVPSHSKCTNNLATIQQQQTSDDLCSYIIPSGGMTHETKDCRNSNTSIAGTTNLFQLSGNNIDDKDHETILSGSLLGEECLGSSNASLQTVDPDKAQDCEPSALMDSVSLPAVHKDTIFHNDSNVIANAVCYNEQLTGSEQLTKSTSSEQLTECTDSEQFPECTNYEQFTESTCSEWFTKCTDSSSVPQLYDTKILSANSTPINFDLKGLTTFSCTDIAFEPDSCKCSEVLPCKTKFNVKTEVELTSDVNLQTLNVYSISQLGLENQDDSNREKLTEPEGGLCDTEINKLSSEINCSNQTEHFPKEDDEENYEKGCDSEDGDQNDCEAQEHITNNFLNAPTTLKNMFIQGNNTHIGNNISFDGSLSVKVLRSLCSLDEEDFLAEIQAALTEKYKTPAFCQVAIPLKSKKIHIRECLSLWLDEVDILVDSHIAKDHINSLTDLAKFLKEQDVHRLLIEGAAGYGKSTLLMQIVYDWANTEESAFASFGLCFLIQGRNVTTSVLKTMLHQVRGIKSDSDDEEDLLRRTLLRMKDPVLILVDGYDELTDKARIEVDRLICLNSLPSAVVVVASRPHKCTKIRENFQKSLLLRGFKVAQIEEYSRTFSKGTMQKVLNVVRDKVHILPSLLQSPLLLYFFCSVAEEQLELQINPSITVLFKAAILKALRRIDVGTQHLQDVDFLVMFGELCVKLLNADKAVFAATDLSICCKEDPTDILLGLGLISIDYNWSGNNNGEQYVVVHKTIMEFHAALYLSTVIDTDDFSMFLCSVLNCDHGFQSLLPQFLVGLSAKKAVCVLKQLPRSLLYPQIFTLCMLMNEMPQQDPSSLLQYLPRSLCLNLNDGFVLVNNTLVSTSHYCLASEVSVSSADDILLCDQQTWKPRLLDLLSQEDLPTRELHLELDSNHVPAINSALDIFNVLGVYSKITTVSMTAAKTTDKLSELFVYLKHLRNLQHLVINFGTLDGCERFLDALILSGTDSYANLKTLQLACSDSLLLSDLQLGKLNELVSACSGLSNLAIQLVASGKSLDALTALLAGAPQLRRLAVILDTSEIIRPKSKRKQENNSLLPKCVLKKLSTTCLYAFGALLTANSCFLTTLDLSLSCLKSEDVLALAVCVVQPACRLTSLLLANCVSASKLPLQINLSALVPQCKKWELLDLSAWQISYDLVSVGTIAKLVALDATVSCLSIRDKNFNCVRLADCFLIQELHCNLDQAFNSENSLLSTSSQLIHLKVCCPCGQPPESSDLPKFFHSLQQLPKLERLELRCRVEDMASDPNFESWSSYVGICSLTGLHLEVVQSSCSNWVQKEIIFKMAQTALVKATKLTTATIVAVDVPYSSFWKTYLPSFMRDVNIGFNAHCLQSLHLSQRQEQQKEFLLHLDHWEVKNKYKLKVDFCYQYGQNKERMDITLQPESIAS